jgi:GT2 family glycosyltransferase
MDTDQHPSPDGTLTIIVVSYHSHEQIKDGLSALLSSPEFAVIIVDNGATEESKTQLETLHLPATIISAGTNLGYGRAANLGLRQAKTSFVLLLNPDLEATRESVLELLRRAGNEDFKHTAIHAPATLKRDYSEGALPRKSNWVSGSAMLFDREKILRIGGFDENIFLFSEDTDLCHRVIAANLEITLHPDILFEHQVGRSSPPSPETEFLKWWHFGWSQCYRMTKHRKTGFWRQPIRKYLSYRLHALLATNPHKRRKWRAKAEGSLAFIRGIPAFRKDGSPQMS